MKRVRHGLHGTVEKWRGVLQAICFAPIQGDFTVIKVGFEYVISTIKRHSRGGLVKWRRVLFTVAYEYVISIRNKYSHGGLITKFTKNIHVVKFTGKLIRLCGVPYFPSKHFKREDPVESESEICCTKIWSIFCSQKSLFELPYFACKDVAKSHCDGTHCSQSSEQRATHDINDHCHKHSSAKSPSCYIGCMLCRWHPSSCIGCMSCPLHPSAGCTPPCVIVVETPTTGLIAHKNSAANCQQKDAENRVENDGGTTMSGFRNLLSLPADSDTLMNKTVWDLGLLPEELLEQILRRMEYVQLFQAKLVSRGWKSLTESNTLLQTLSKSSTLSLLYLYIKDGEVQWSGFDVVMKKWRSLPTLRCLPSPAQNLFKEYHVTSAGGLVCANISKNKYERVVVCNPMTQKSRVLPPLTFPRNPVLLHILVNPNAKSYLIIAAGSSGMDEGHLSRKIEVFDSLTSQWEVTDDIPGFEFGLNEYQTGVCVDGILYCVAFLEDGSGKGLLAYDVKQRKWLSDWRIPLPCPGHSNSFSIAQVVECDNQVYLFSEREITGHAVEHRIDKLDTTDRASGVGTWTNVVRENKPGGRGLLVYPEYACAGFGVGKLCIFNTLEHTGKAYDMRHGGPPELLPGPQTKGVEVLHSLNPLSVTFEPNFRNLVEMPP